MAVGFAADHSGDLEHGIHEVMGSIRRHLSQSLTDDGRALVRTRLIGRCGIRYDVASALGR